MNPAAAPTRLRLLSPEGLRLLQLALTLLAALYLLFAGGTFDATLRYRVKLLNFAAGLALAGAWLLLRRRQRRPLAASGLEGPLVLLAASQWLAVATSLRPRLSLEWAAGLLAWVVAFWLLHDVLARGWPRRYVWQALIVLAALLAGHGVLAAAQWYAGWLALGQLPPVTFRYAGLLGHANLTACLLNLLLPVVLGHLLTVTRRAGQAALAVLAAAMLLTEFLTSSRAGWLACAATLGVFALLWALRGDLRRYWPTWRARWQSLGRVGQAAAALGALAAAAAAGALLLRQSQHITHGSLFQSRQEFWGAAWALFRLQPLTGAGPDLFPWYYTATTSVPPGFLAPHAHSLVLQVLSGSGLVGVAALGWLAAAAALRLARQWHAGGRELPVAGALAGLAGFGVQHLFDYLLGTPLTWWLVIGLAALVPAPAAPATEPSARRLPLWLPGLFTLVAAGVFAFGLRGEALNEAGLSLAARGDWATAAGRFQAAAQADPALSVYAQSAAFAYTRAGEVDRALPLWLAAAQADPYWAVLPATVAVLAHDASSLAAAQALAPNSDLLALNAGALAEAQGDAEAARAAYRRALGLRPSSAAALFWQQTSLRRAAVSEWQTTQPPDTSALAQGEAALVNGAAAEARSWFEQARAANPADNRPYAGLARAAWLAGDLAQAQADVEVGLRIPVANAAETLSLRLLAGELAAAAGDRAAALAAYTTVFSAVNDYTCLGPGTYGYPQRSWYVYHRAALPSDLVPQFARADITAAMDADFAQLAEWYRAEGDAAAACLILGRVAVEAPQSISGAAWRATCAP
ncbi:MAG: O-antigen ligase family protein [Anaerolineales bacterium]|nr:O-antigen ligase family protein [Anaerolineales bacterium]